MAVVTKRVLALKFGYTNDADATTTLNISKPASSLDDATIKGVMEAVVAANGLKKKDKTTAVDKIVEANYINTETEELAL